MKKEICDLKKSNIADTISLKIFIANYHRDQIIFMKKNISSLQRSICSILLLFIYICFEYLNSLRKWFHQEKIRYIFQATHLYYHLCPDFTSFNYYLFRPTHKTTSLVHLVPRFHGPDRNGRQIDLVDLTIFFCLELSVLKT